MKSYQVLFRCPSCKRKHRAPVHVELARGPAEEESVGEVFADRARPPEIDNLGNLRFLCPRTSRYVQPDEDDLTIAPEDRAVAGRPAREKKPRRAARKRKKAGASRR